MSYWAQAPQGREQLVLFATRLDEALPAEHSVRLLDEILGRLDWSKWEAAYHGRRGQPPIHPRVLAAALLYGLLKRIRSSRALEEALLVRMDFRWLVEGRAIDHTTLSEFRRRHAAALKDLFVQIGFVARESGLLPLAQLAYDGTRIRANNRRGGTRTPEELRELRTSLGDKFTEIEQRIAAEDAREEEVFGESALPAELADVRRRQAQVDAALAELARVEAAEETVPKRLPVTDPESRLTPNKDGGFAPNFTPLATVDAAHGFIVAADVIAKTDEEHHLLSQLDAVRKDFALAALPGEVLADGAMPTGENLQALEEQGVTLYAPAAELDPAKNPAIREDPTQPVAEERWAELPTSKVKDGSASRPQLKKEAFVYDAARDVYWCPAGQSLAKEQTTSERQGAGRAVRTRYKAAESSCAACPLRARCLQAGAARREISRYAHDALQEKLARRMATDEARAKYARRREVGERPFAVIKHQFGARRFLLRGLQQVRTEWRWLVTAFNLERLLSHFTRERLKATLMNRAGPATPQPT
jgi:transposase